MSDLHEMIGELDEVLRSQMSGPYGNARSYLVLVLRDIATEIETLKKPLRDPARTEVTER